MTPLQRARRKIRGQLRRILVDRLMARLLKLASAHMED